MRIILLGPQRRPTVDAAVRLLGEPDAQVATVTAGWQEREADDGELSRCLGERDVNLRLYQRWLDVQERDPEYAAGERRLSAILAELQELYLLRLDHALQAVYALQRRESGDRLRSESVSAAVAAVRELDTAHLRRCNEARLQFFDRLRPHDRPAIAEHRAAVTAAITQAGALAIAGGHVGVLAEVLHLFNVAAALKETLNGTPVIAWSAGAMALTDRIVLFHDRAPQGPGQPEVWASGLSLVRDAVLLPHARARLLLDDAARMAVLARRFAPARCVLLETGTRLELGPDGSWPPGTRVLTEDGHAVSEAA
ncbi:MAG: Type 1 glutamine amidotransferase-like domain-containing protein [Streptosporangiaceae bacterium]